jgi:hypothetical protein
MKTKSLLKTGVLCMATIGCFDVSGTVDQPALGVATAEAKDYYTRKKIDGRWVTGIFPKKGTKLEAEFQARAAAQAAAAEQPKQTLLGLNIPGVDLTYRPPMSAQASNQAQQPSQETALQAVTSGNASYTSAKDEKPGRLIVGTPGVQDRGDVLKEKQETSRKVARAAAPKPERVAKAEAQPKVRATAAERRRADEEFATAVTQPTQATPAAVPAAVQSYAPMPERDDLLTALQRKARSMAEEGSGTTGSIALPAAPAQRTQAGALPVRSASAGKPIRSVTFDYENSIKTIIFQDGTIQEEHVAREP